MYVEKLFKRHGIKKSQLVLEPCKSNVTDTFLNQQRKRGLTQVQLTNNALLLASNVFVLKTNLHTSSVSRNKMGQLIHVDLMDIPHKVGVRITKDGLFISNWKPEFKCIAKYVKSMADHGWWLSQLMSDTPRLTASEQNKQSHGGVSFRIADVAKPNPHRLLARRTSK